MSSASVAAALALPARELGMALLAIVEDQWYDRKSALMAPQTLVQHQIAMANADGGILVVGLWSGRVEGTDAAPSHRSGLMQAAIDFSNPPVRARGRLVECVNDDGDFDHLLVFDIDPSEIVHVSHKDQVFLRVGDELRKLSFLQRQELLYDRGQAVFESTHPQGAGLVDLDEGLVSSYAKALAHPEPERLLVARNLAAPDGAPTAAGLLLFGRAPQSWFPEAYVRVLRYQGTERGAGRHQRLLSDRPCEGPIPAVLELARKEIEVVQPARRALTGSGRFGRIGPVPSDAWLEGLVNAVVHRSYSMSGDHIRVEVFDDRIEIESPGRFPGLAGGGDPLLATRFARNPRIARVCADLDFGQELGEGIRRIFQEMRDAGLSDPLYRQTSGSVRLSLSGVPVDRTLEATLPSDARTLLAILREAGQLGTGELVDSSGFSRPFVISRLNALRDAGLVEWTGTSKKDPRASWRLPQP